MYPVGKLLPLGHPGVWELWVCWGGLLADGWDGKPACLILEPDLSDSVWLLCCAGTLKLFLSLLFTLPPGSSPGVSPGVFLAAPSDTMGNVCA